MEFVELVRGEAKERDRQAVVVLKQGLRILRRGGWIKGSYSGRDNSHCMLGAIYVASTISRSLTSDDELRSERTLRQVVRQHFPDRLRLHKATVPAFNDHRDTTFEDVEFVFEKAILELGGEL